MKETYQEKISRLLHEHVGTDDVTFLDFKNAHGTAAEKSRNEEKIPEFINAKLP